MIFRATVGDGGTAKSVGRAEHLKLLPDTEQEIIFLGDSITEQAEWPELLGSLRVKNRGIGADTTIRIIRRLDEVLSSVPSKVFLMAFIRTFISKAV